MTRYTLHANANVEAFATILPGVSVAKAVEAITGRQPGPWLSRNLHRKGVCYCAAHGRGGRSGVVVRATTNTPASSLKS